MNNHKVKYFIIVIAFLAVAWILLKIHSLPEDYLPLKDYSEVDTVQIVLIGENFCESGEIEQKVLTTIEAKDDFISDFKKIYCNAIIPGSAPDAVIAGDVAVRFVLENGDYELVAPSGQSRYKDGAFLLYKGYFNFDKEEFEALISKYTNESD